MKDKPILFTADMYQAIIDGRKTQTRRVITVPWRKGKRCLPYQPYYTESDGQLYYMDEAGEFHSMLKLSPHKAGDRLWVKEPFQVISSLPGGVVKGKYTRYDTDFICTLSDTGFMKFLKWKKPYSGKSSLFMFRSLARLWLEIVSIRVERLQDISEEDAIREGICKVDQGLNTLSGCPLYSVNSAADPLKHYSDSSETFDTARMAFYVLWDSINKKRGCGWDENPWVWVTEFKKV